MAQVTEPQKFWLVEFRFWVLQSGIQLKESRIRLRLKIRNQVPLTKNLQFSTWNPEIQNPRQSWIPLHYMGRLLTDVSLWFQLATILPPIYIILEVKIQRIHSLATLLRRKYLHYQQPLQDKHWHCSITWLYSLTTWYTDMESPFSPSSRLYFFFPITIYGVPFLSLLKHYFQRGRSLLTWVFIFVFNSGRPSILK